MDLKGLDVVIVGLSLAFVIWLYFRSNPMKHSKKFIWRRFTNWFPLGMSYAFLYMARYNLNVAKNAMGTMMSNQDFGIIFAAGTTVYGLSFLLNGPLVDKIGGKKGMIIATIGSSIMNVLMGGATYLYLNNSLKFNMVLVFSLLYAANMFFQSYGAVSIIKVKAYWFHVRERGIFGAIFGTLISVGLYFAFDWVQAIVDATKVHIEGTPTLLQRTFHYVFALDNATQDPIWLAFLVPAFILLIWALIDTWLIADKPSHANFEDFDTHDASSGEADEGVRMWEILKTILTSPIMLTIALVEFTAGIIRNGILQWYFIFAKQVPQVGAEFIGKNWGLILCMTGITGGFMTGYISDHWFHSRRGPAAGLNAAAIVVLTIIMSFVIKASPIGVGLCAVFISLFVIGIHAIMSGTAAADFGGKKMTATASGITDGFVYLGSGVQSVAIGYLSARDWRYWPMFLIPFAMAGLYLCWRMWHELPEPTRKYLATVENVKLHKKAPKLAHKTSSTKLAEEAS